MEIITWVILGALAGWIASMIAGTNSSMGAVANIIMGIVGAVIGGFLFNLAGSTDVTGSNFWSLFVATIGAVVLLFVIKSLHRST